MNRLSFALAMLCVLHGPLSGAQSSTGSRSYLVRMQRMTLQYAEAENVCVAVFADGSFRRERQILPANTPISKSKTDVFQGRLSDAELRDLLEKLNDQSFREIPSTASLKRTSVRDEALTIMVRRGTSDQHLAFPDKEARGHHQKTLQPLLRTFRSFEKHQAAELKDATPDRCKVQ